jgi:CHAT domain-containing protein
MTAGERRGSLGVVAALVLALAGPHRSSAGPAAPATPAPAPVQSPASEPAYHAAMRAFQAKDDAGALTLFQAALADARARGDRPATANVLGYIGLVSMRLGRPQDALFAATQALSIDHALRNRAAEATDLSESGRAYQELHRYADALGAYRQALAIHRELHVRVGEAVDLTDIGTVFRQLDRHAEALAAHDAALTIERETGDREGEANSHSYIGTSYEALSRYGDALAAFERAAAVTRELRDRAGEASQLNSAASVYGRLGRYTQALAVLANALALSREAGAEKIQAEVLRHTGHVYSDVGRYADALAMHERALALDRTNGRAFGEAEDLRSIGQVYHTLGRTDDALASFQRALATHRAARDRPGEARALISLGGVLDESERYADALPLYRQALAIYRDLHDRANEATVLSIIGVAEEGLHRHGDALATQRQGLAIQRSIHNERGEGAALFYVAAAEIFLDRRAEAERDASRGIALQRKLGVASVWNTLAMLALAESSWGARYEAAAQRHFDEALNRIEALRAALTGDKNRTSFFVTTLKTYDDDIAFLMRLHQRHPGQGYDRKAFDVFERKAARAALEQIAASAAQHYAGVPQSVVEQETAGDVAVENATELQARLLSTAPVDRAAAEGAGRSARALAHEQAALEASIAAQYPQYYALRHPRPIAAAALQRTVLAPGQALLVYDVLPGRSVVWLVTRDRFQAVALPSRTKLDAAVSAFTEHIARIEAGTTGAARDLAGFDRDSYALYRSVMPPAVAVGVAAAKSIIVVQSGSLYQVPFGALVSRDPARTAGRAHYLVEDAAISYAPSASLFAVVARSYAGRHAAAHPLLAFANPAFSQSSAPRDLQLDAMRSALLRGSSGNALPGFAPLPGTATEAEGVRKALDAPADSVVAGDAATRQRVRAMDAAGSLKTFRYVLFATHAIIPGRIAGLTQPAIVLAHPEQGDGFLTMADVFALSLNADFVALSACDTGVVANPRGDGISGLTRAFLYAGTPAVSVTLWQVDDAAAPRITPPFFAAMSAGQSAAEALRAAQTAMIGAREARYRHPFAWAPYVIFGDGDLAGAAR